MADDANFFEQRSNVTPLAVVRQRTPAEPEMSPYSDDTLALRFSLQHKDELRYVAAWGRWLQWTGSKWENDTTLNVYDRARALCREVALETEKPGIQRDLTSGRTIASVEKLARSDRRHAATVDQWDFDPWLLNTPDGIINLHTGTTLPHDPAQHMTKITSVGPSEGCPMWMDFLDRVTAGNGSLQGYLQRVCGYALTGTTTEHALFFAFGTGRNGKGVFLNTITNIMGDYACVAPIETFTATQQDKHETGLAFLRGARLVAAQETEEGRNWAENKIKALTGGDPITARYMRQDFFTFTPQFKLFIAGNHKPGLRNVDEAIRARLHLIPFDVTIPEAERDPLLPEKLKAEWPGILDWMITGCLDSQAVRLKAPDAVKQATADYFEAEDATALWLSEFCIQGKQLWSASAQLYASWKVWAEKAGEAVGSQKRFGQNLLGRGFKDERGTDGKRGFRGIGFKPLSDNGRWGNQ